LTAGERVGAFLDEGTPAPQLHIESSAALLQMVRENGDGPGADLGAKGPGFVILNESNVPEMMALTELTKPGPFNERTHQMGEYFGIRCDGKLVAMAGERLRVPGYTEISAICTHPDRLGKGHAAALTSLLIHRIIDRGERPFLHVRAENTRAVALYERLGFEKRWLGRYVILHA
jgi:predicted GNAT family acetyltransferase